MTIEGNEREGADAFPVTMTKKLLFVMTLLLAASLAVFAADVSGKWIYSQPGRGGGDPVQVTISLKADGGAVTGTVTRPGRNGNMEAPISAGKIDGNTITFKTSQEMGGNTITTDYTGTISGDDMKLKVTRPGRNGGEPQTNEFTAKRSTT